MITVARTGVSFVLVVLAAAQESWPLLLAAYLTYWAGDVVDGAVARRRGQETRLGAVLDVLCDRVNTTSCALVLLLFVPAGLPVTIFLIQFVLVDTALTLITLRWPLLSPNYFALVDRWVYAMNWHPLAKATNTGLLVVLVVAVPDHCWAFGTAVVVLVVKVVSLVRTGRLLAAQRPSAAMNHVAIRVGTTPVAPVETRRR